MEEDPVSLIVCSGREKQRLPEQNRPVGLVIGISMNIHRLMFCGFSPVGCCSKGWGLGLCGWGVGGGGEKEGEGVQGEGGRGSRA